VRSLLDFLFRNDVVSFRQRLFIVKRFVRISYFVPCPHTSDEMLSIITSILTLTPDLEGDVVEAGSFKGGSTAKLSIASKMMNKQLVAFDSFEGIPENEELMPNGKPYHPAGIWCGTLDEVKRNIKQYGVLEACEFIKGWFDDTMPGFKRPIAVAYIDVDLASSTRTCLKHLFPLLVPGGVLFSQDGHLPLVVDVFDDDEFWLNEVGCPKPQIEGLGERKLIRIVKPAEGGTPGGNPWSEG